jgi:HPt (histidine-containing phosphotransfer) domain-containing protein
MTSTSESQVNPYTCGPPARGLTVWSPPATILELARDESSLVADLIQSFTADVADRLQQVRGAMTRTDAAVLRYQIHAIKGSSKQMGADRVGAICDQIEAGIKDRPISQLVDLVRQLEVRVGEVCAAMAWYQNSDRQRAS